MAQLITVPNSYVSTNILLATNEGEGIVGSSSQNLFRFYDFGNRISPITMDSLTVNKFFSWPYGSLNYFEISDGYVFDSSNYILIGSYGARGGIFKTKNGGKVFNLVGLDPFIKPTDTSYMYAYGSSRIKFFDNSPIGIAASYKGIARTTDYGENWSLIHSVDSNFYFNAICTSPNGEVIVYNDNEEFFSNGAYYSNDYGRTFSKVIFNYNNIKHTKFLTPKVGFAVGKERGMDNYFISDVLKTSDGGVSWIKVNETTSPLKSLHLINENLGYVEYEVGLPEFGYSRDRIGYTSNGLKHFAPIVSDKNDYSIHYALKSIHYSSNVSLFATNFYQYTKSGPGPYKPVANINVLDTVSHPSEIEIKLSADKSYQSYQWKVNGILLAESKDFSLKKTYGSGNIRVRLIVSDGISVDSLERPFYFDSKLIVKSKEQTHHLLFPDSKLTIIGQNIDKARRITMAGEEVKTFSVLNSNIVLTFENAKSGDLIFYGPFNNDTLKGLTIMPHLNYDIPISFNKYGFCKNDSVTVKIHNSQIDYYYVFTGQPNTTFPTSLPRVTIKGTGEDISYTYRNLNQDYNLKVYLGYDYYGSVSANTEINNQNQLVQFENAEAQVQISTLNAEINEALTIRNVNTQAVINHWIYLNGMEGLPKESLELKDISFNTIGNKQFQLISQTKSGCRDTSKIYTFAIHQSLANVSDTCFAFTTRINQNFAEVPSNNTNIAMAPAFFKNGDYIMVNKGYNVNVAGSTGPNLEYGQQASVIVYYTKSGLPKWQIPIYNQAEIIAYEIDPYDNLVIYGVSHYMASYIVLRSGEKKVIYAYNDKVSYYTSNPKGTFVYKLNKDGALIWDLVIANARLKDPNSTLLFNRTDENNKSYLSVSKNRIAVALYAQSNLQISILKGNVKVHSIPDESSNGSPIVVLDENGEFHSYSYLAGIADKIQFNRGFTLNPENNDMMLHIYMSENRNVYDQDIHGQFVTLDKNLNRIGARALNLSKNDAHSFILKLDGEGKVKWIKSIALNYKESPLLTEINFTFKNNNAFASFEVYYSNGSVYLSLYDSLHTDKILLHGSNIIKFASNGAIQWHVGNSEQATFTDISDNEIVTYSLLSAQYPRDIYFKSYLKNRTYVNLGAKPSNYTYVYRNSYDLDGNLLNAKYFKANSAETFYGKMIGFRNRNNRNYFHLFNTSLFNLNQVSIFSKDVKVGMMGSAVLSTNQDLCTSKVSNNIIIDAGDDVFNCTGKPIKLVSSVPVGVNYNWFFEDGTLIATNKDTQYIPKKAGFIYLVANNSEGYVAVDSFKFTSTPLDFQAKANKDTIVCYNSKIQLGHNDHGIGYTYKWTSNKNYQSNEPNPEVNISQKESFYLEVTSSNQCISYDTIHVSVEPPNERPFIYIDHLTISTPRIHCENTSRTFVASGSNLGMKPAFEWYLNETLIGEKDTLTTNTIRKNDQLVVKVRNTNQCNTIDTAVQDLSHYFLSLSKNIDLKVELAGLNSEICRNISPYMINVARNAQIDAYAGTVLKNGLPLSYINTSSHSAIVSPDSLNVGDKVQLRVLPITTNSQCWVNDTVYSNVIQISKVYPDYRSGILELKVLDTLVNKFIINVSNPNNLPLEKLDWYSKNVGANIWNKYSNYQSSTIEFDFPVSETKLQLQYNDEVCKVSVNSNILNLKKVERIAETDDVTIVPNPATNNIKIQLDNLIDKYDKLIIIDAYGKVLNNSSININANSVSLNITTYPKGLYHGMFVNTISAKTKSFKFVKQ